MISKYMIAVVSPRQSAMLEYYLEGQLKVNGNEWCYFLGQVHYWSTWASSYNAYITRPQVDA